MPYDLRGQRRVVFKGNSVARVTGEMVDVERNRSEMEIVIRDGVVRQKELLLIFQFLQCMILSCKQYLLTRVFKF